MKKSTAVIIWMALIAIPLICRGLLYKATWGLVLLVIEIYYFYPISWLGEPFFVYSPDLLAYVARWPGFILGISVYSIIFWVIYSIYEKSRKNS